MTSHNRLKLWTALALCIGGVDPGSARAVAGEPVLMNAGGGPRPSPIVVSSMGPGVIPGDDRHFLYCTIKNPLGVPVHLPVPLLGHGRPNLTLTVEKDGAEEVTYCHARAGREEHAAIYTPVLQLPPRQETILVKWFVPWTPGTYSYTLRLSNTLHRRKINRIVQKPARTGFPLFSSEEAVEAIPMVWVGDVTMRGTFTVSERVYVRTERNLAHLRATVTDTHTPPHKRVLALRGICEMRHSWATDALIAIERQTRTEEVLHSLVLAQLHDMAYRGTGYRALSSFAEIAAKRDAPVTERVLCIDVLLTFARNKHIKDEGRVIHVVTREERKIATDALAALRANTDVEPEQVRHLLEPPEDE
ncbi:MAG: hypothetical protein HQ559_08435 [Lentisphaerae bacterium]|nr:hypothetical protein [Lentisphaerota bacterium]